MCTAKLTKLPNAIVQKCSLFTSKTPSNTDTYTPGGGRELEWEGVVVREGGGNHMVPVLAQSDCIYLSEGLVQQWQHMFRRCL